MTNMKIELYKDGDFNDEITNLAIAQEREACAEIIKESAREFTETGHTDIAAALLSAEQEIRERNET